MSESILIADDEIHIRRLIEQSLEDLEDEGIDIQSVGNGEDALSFIQTEKPRLVILDVMMPKMNGFDVCDRVKRDPDLKHIHVILLTAKGQEHDRQRGEEVNADTYMTKPFDSDALLALACEIMGISV
jgi:CheY-like chemotaxis protein